MNNDNFFLYNSLTKQLDKLDLPKDKTIGWYSCGPTVYDSAHLGHARTYLTFDIIKRVLEYSGYSINYVMNITDIDDKIINRVRENMVKNGLPADAKMDNAFYHQFVRQQEQLFWEDMDSLGIDRPHIVTRVTEYIDKIIAFIEKIQENGFAYESNGSVYFDSGKYKEAGFNFSPLLEMVSEKSDNEFLGEKRSYEDFALWKKAKTGELKFSSKWSEGRPGWHIECSVMASDILGTEFMIHSGGIDLIFPHHNNEIIQAGAYVNEKDHKWVCMFLHSGHLNIEGLKMAKSLKNFVTIKQYLQNVGTAQQLRLLFLTHRWHKPLDYSQESIDETKRIEKRIGDFLKHISFLKKELPQIKSKFTQNDVDYAESVKNIKFLVNVALRDNIDTQIVINTLLDGINKTYGYLGTEYNWTLIGEFVIFLERMLELFGLEFKNNDQDVNADQWIKLAVDLREDIRDIVKNNKKDISKPVMGELFKLLDDFRDTKLTTLGVKLEDRGQNRSTKWSII
jgi:cysteinyl-tRNA synthetase